ncbi:histone-lysine N-methyltransferase SETD2 isoform X2 [Scyliorhinus canicula]|uniref:histone-lysine N-methyltransferase SETD2 isoform X2 n=1 Tax=Scyliorhinus canicula TaxID=7830 RepID=UPI0018F559D9|nr:histone-lysine N-methyltransferase SETD2 isoform X2 [Scyliorhinus canicula]
MLNCGDAHHKGVGESTIEFVRHSEIGGKHLGTTQQAGIPSSKEEDRNGSLSYCSSSSAHVVQGNPNRKRSHIRFNPAGKGIALAKKLGHMEFTCSDRWLDRFKSSSVQAPAPPHPLPSAREGWTELQMSPGPSTHLQVQSTGDTLAVGEDENAVKVENPSVLSVLKGQVTKGCSRFLPKGTKAKVNLEDQGRQKVSFTFNVTKTLRNRFQSAIGTEPDEVKIPPLTLPPISVKGSQDSKSDSDSADATETTTSPPKSKVEWSKVHFKKKHLNDAAKPAGLPDRELCSSSLEEPVDAAVKKDCTGGTDTVTKVAAERMSSNPNLSTSHIGKGDNLEEFTNVSSSSSENDELRKVTQGDEAVQAQSAGSESEGDSLRKSQEMRNTESDRDVKKNPITSKVDEVEKVSSHSKSERDKRSSGRSKSDRDLRRTSSRSKYAREERVSSSRSRSDRDSRVPSSYSKSDRSRTSYYRDKDRGYRRSSPYSERSKSSRSKLGPDLRDVSSCSDSEEDSRRYHPRSNDLRRAPLCSKSYRDSRKYQSRSDRDLRATSSCSESEREIKRTKSHPKSDRMCRMSCYESESSKINSPEPESDSRKMSKSDSHPKTSSFQSKVSCHKPEVVKTNLPDLEWDCKKIAKSDDLSRTSSSHSKPVTSFHEVAAKKDPPEPEVDSKCFKQGSNSRALPSHSKLSTCGIEADVGDCSELESDSKSGHNPDINSRLSPLHSKSTTYCEMEVVKIESSESELDSWSKSMSDQNPMVTPPHSKPTTCYEMEVVETDFAESELDPWTNSRLDKNSIVTQSHSKSTTCYEMEVVKMEPSQPEPELDYWEKCKLDRKSRITASSSRSCKVRTLRSCAPGNELKSTSCSESEDELREVPELHTSGTMQTVSRSDEICSSFDHQSDNYVSTSPYSTCDLPRAFCHSRFAVEIAGPSPGSRLDGALTKVSSCSESEEDQGSSPHCKADLTVSCHSLSNELLSLPTFTAKDLKTSPHPDSHETRSLAHPKLEEFSPWHYTKTEEILACPKLDKAASVPCSNLDTTRTISVDVKCCTREAKHIGESSTENRDVDSQREQHISEVDGAESKHGRLFHNCKSKPNVVPGNQNWDSFEKVILYTDLPSHLASESWESSEVKTQNPSTNNEETSFTARPDSSVKVESEHSMEISEDEEETDDEMAAEGPLPLNTANLPCSNEAEHSFQNYKTKSDCDSSCMKAECNSVNSENEECLEVAKSSSESEESETSSDSDDSGVPRNRLQSVIIVPKNSTLTLENSQSSSPSSSSPSSRSNRQEKKQSSGEGGKREANEKPSQEHERNSVQFGSAPQEFIAGWPKGGDEVQGSQLSSPKAVEEQTQASSSQLSPIGETCKSSKQQLLSDKADSTSQPDRFSPDQNRLPLADEKSGSTEAAQQSADRLGERHQHPLKSYSDSLATGESIAQPSGGLEKNQGEKPDSGQAIPWLQPQARDQGSFHSPKFVDSLDWDFSQSEKPSSSCQQPDSSYGLRYGYRTEEADLGERSSCWQASRINYWDPRLQSKSALYSSYQLSQDISGSDVQGQVQPDSMTDDFAIYNSWETVSRDPRTVAKGVSSLQAHEITSNSSKGTTLVLKASDSTADKEPRAKGLEKKLDERGESQKPQHEEVDTDLESDTDTRDCEQVNTEPDPHPMMSCKKWVTIVCKMEEFKSTQCWKERSKLGFMPPYFELIEENLYLTERKKSKSHRDIKRMQCECLLSREDRERGELACGEDCLNRLLMIECSSRCLHGEYCTNRRFQRRLYADVEVILTERKGWGLRTDKELSVNSFVLEYCGEVLDHKEFKARVKEYARNKNIHYYFMALKNDEIIDATLKGNCSRFMNHSCEPNCETQKWTVNGQLRVGFFTTKTVPAGTELTFDYQFQRYGKEAQKCFCGSANCRGYLGGENRVSIRAAGGKVKLKDKDRSRKKDSVDEELEAFLENGDGLCDSNHVLSLTRLMVRIETMEQKLTCLKIIQNTHSQSCLKSFLEYHGLSLLWIWMTELGDSRGNSSNNIKLQTEIMKTLEQLPISTKNMLEESKLLPIIQRWAQTKASAPQVSEADGYSSENTSRAQTPLNTQDPAVKLSAEIDGDRQKKLVMKRLKIMSENSMDSGLSDTSKASDGEIEIKEVKDEVVAAVERPSCLPLDEEDAPGEVPADDAEAQETDSASKATNGTKLEEGTLVETPSQDEEEGVSDAESERSQEQPGKIEDVSELAMKLLDVWKDLKEVYRIPKKDRSQTERESTERGRDGTSQKDVSQTPKTPVNLGKEKDADKTLSKDRKKRKPATSPPPSAYERDGLKRSVPDERYDGATPAKKKKTRSKLSTEERRKLFEQEVAQREAQKQNLYLVQQQQQQPIQPICVSSQVPYDSATYSNSHQNFATYPPGYPLQTYVDPVNPNAGKVLLPTPNVEPLCPSQMGYEHPQTLLAETMPAGHSTVQHLSPQVDVQGQQYLAPTPVVIPQDPNVPVIQVPGTPTTGQSYGMWDPNQQTLAVHQQYASGQPPAPMYYQGQPCQPVYSISSPYGPATQQIVQPELIVVNSLLDLPPPSPPKPKTIILPSNWKTARDPEGKIYYYHVITRQTQWDPPLWDAGSDDMSVGHEAEMDLGTPTYDENPAKDPMLTELHGQDGSGDGTPNSYSQSSKKKPKTAEADTSSELAKRSKEMFRKEISQFIVLCLNPYRKPDCKLGRIVATEDFKHLARKLTHGVMNKELKQCKNPEDLECNENVKHKTKEYIKKYMQKFGAIYKPKEEPDVD